jgi:hypothetical protein
MDSHESLIDALKTDTTNLYKTPSNRAITYQEAHSELLNAYDKGHGFDTGTHGVSMSEDEDPTKDSLNQAWFKLYLRENVYKHTGDSFDVFINQPRWKIQMKLEEITKRNKEEAQIAESIKAGFENGKE